MELKLFGDLIDVLGKVTGGLKAIINLPEAEWETIRQTLDETHRLSDTMPNMVILRAALRLDNDNELMQAEPAFRQRTKSRRTQRIQGYMP